MGGRDLGYQVLHRGRPAHAATEPRVVVVAALRRRLSREAARRKSERRRQAREGGAGKKEKFIRNDKARTMTNREVRGIIAVEDV